MEGLRCPASEDSGSVPPASDWQFSDSSGVWLDDCHLALSVTKETCKAVRVGFDDFLKVEGRWSYGRQVNIILLAPVESWWP
jgi:hypothetical protein